jgi:hypothetical protein
MAKLKTRADIVAEGIAQDGNMSLARRRFNRQIRTMLKNYRAQVEALLRRPKTFDAGDRLKIAAAQRIADQLTTVLGESGMNDLVADYKDEFPALTKSSLKYFSALDESPSLAGVDKDRLKAYVRFTTGNLTESLNKRYVYPVQEAIFQTTFGTQSIPDAIDNVMSRFDNMSPANAETLVIDNLIKYERAVTVEKARAVDLNIYIYTGPDDEITSEQCQFLLGINDHGLEGALYEDEISADLHEKLTDNPLIAGGHINCRHKYMPVTLDFAVSMGFEPRAGDEEGAAAVEALAA